MSIKHHPDEIMLAAYAAGTLDLGQHAAVATHLLACPQCRNWVHALERIGGAVLEDLPPAAMAKDALNATTKRIGEPAPARLRPVAAETATPGLPGFVRGFRFGHWQWVAPRVSLRRIVLPEPSPTRIFLLRSGPGTRMLEHSHTGLEMTCILAGGFSHAGGHFQPGDFDLGDESILHQPVVDAGEECICLVAMQGDLRLKGLTGRLMQPFIRL